MAKKGVVYVLQNESMEEDLLKIGETEKEAEERAKQLSQGKTALPTPFKVVHFREFADCQKAEKIIHTKLNHYRYNPNREFFKMPLWKAIKTIDDLAFEELKREKSHVESKLNLLVDLLKKPESFEDKVISLNKKLKGFKTLSKLTKTEEKKLLINKKHENFAEQIQFLEEQKKVLDSYKNESENKLNLLVDLIKKPESFEDKIDNLNSKLSLFKLTLKRVKDNDKLFMESKCKNLEEKIQFLEKQKRLLDKLK